MRGGVSLNPIRLFRGSVHDGLLTDADAAFESSIQV